MKLACFPLLAWQGTIITLRAPEAPSSRRRRRNSKYPLLPGGVTLDRPLDVLLQSDTNAR